MIVSERFGSSCGAGEVYRQLKTMLVEYHFRPHEQIFLEQIAEQFQVSVTPVREALIRLHSEALLDTTTDRGFYSRTLDLKEMIELAELRFAILRWAAEKYGDSPDAAICPATTKPAMVETTFASAIGANSGRTDMHKSAAHLLEECYERLILLSRNDVMLAVLRNANERTHYIRMIQLEASDRLKEALSTVDEILSAFHRRNLSSAARALTQALESELRLLPALVKEGIFRAYSSRGLETEARQKRRRKHFSVTPSATTTVRDKYRRT